MEKLDLKSMTLREVEDFVEAEGEELYRARQIWSWLYRKKVTEIDLMTNMPGRLRSDLKNAAFLSSLTPVRVLTSHDRTSKYLFSLEDRRCIESVLIPEKDYFTLCLSTQLGCALKCRFCYTGRQGLVRNLTTAEIVNQLDAVLKHTGDRRTVKNIVLMGMGEPLVNYHNTLKALEIILHPLGFNFSHRRVTLSTAGLIPELRRLGQDSPVNLAISLNAADNRTRSFLMPINRRYPLEDLLNACKEYPLAPRKRITFEYILIAGVNDSLKDAQKLVGLLRQMRCKINLIPFNEHPGTELKRPDPQRVKAFQNLLCSSGYTATVRESGGRDIMAACGQLGGERDRPNRPDQPNKPDRRNQKKEELQNGTNAFDY